jgi:alpha-tubulin suppressor-like RCC1 family protein
VYSALAVSSTSSFACGIRDELVECWGANDRGQTGAFDGNTNLPIHPTYTPNPVVGLAGCTAVTAGDQHACALCGGEIHCWGDNTAGSLGSGPLTFDPVPVPRTIDLVLEGDPWVELFSGLRFSCARSEAGHVYCWGSSPHAGLGNGATSANLPVTVLASPIR